MLTAIRLRYQIRNARADIRMAQAALRHAQDDVERLPAQIRVWEQREAELVCALATLPRRDWPSIALASSIGAALALVLVYFFTLV
jgi:hypothetical protein